MNGEDDSPQVLESFQNLQERDQYNMQSGPEIDDSGSTSRLEQPHLALEGVPGGIRKRKYLDFHSESCTDHPDELRRESDLVAMKGEDDSFQVAESLQSLQEPEIDDPGNTPRLEQPYPALEGVPEGRSLLDHEDFASFLRSPPPYSNPDLTLTGNQRDLFNERLEASESRDAERVKPLRSFISLLKPDAMKKVRWTVKRLEKRLESGRLSWRALFSDKWFQLNTGNKNEAMLLAACIAELANRLPLEITISRTILSCLRQIADNIISDTACINPPKRFNYSRDYCQYLVAELNYVDAKTSVWTTTKVFIPPNQMDSLADVPEVPNHADFPPLKSSRRQSPAREKASRVLNLAYYHFNLSIADASQLEAEISKMIQQFQYPWRRDAVALLEQRN